MENKRLYVGNLKYSATDDDLKELFSAHGEVTSVRVIDQKGFGFVEMETIEQAEAAAEALNGQDWMGRTLRIDEARPKKEFSR